MEDIKEIKDLFQFILQADDIGHDSSFGSDIIIPVYDISPEEFLAFAENAAANGAEFRFDTEVQNIRKTSQGWEIETSKGVFLTKTVINAAGVYADRFHNMVSEKKLCITPRRGSYCLLDKSAGTHVNRTVFSLPGKYGKGILVTPTVHGNLLLGPTAEDIENKAVSYTHLTLPTIA